MTAGGLEAWLGTVPDLCPEVSTRARDLFNQHTVDADLLDFFVSEDGQRVLDAWRAGGEQAAQPACASEAPAAAARPGGHGRQRISAADRRNGGHYFSTAPSREVPAVGEALGRSGHSSSKISEKHTPPKESSDAARHELTKGRGKKIPPEDVSWKEDVPKREPSKGKGKKMSGAPDDSKLMSKGNKEDVPKREPSKGKGKKMSGAPDDSKLMSKGNKVTSSFEDGAWQSREEKAREAHGLFYASSSTAVSSSARPASVVLEERFKGTLKSFSRDTGYGFIQCEQVAQDVFLTAAESPEDGRTEPGRVVEFVLAYNRMNKPQAKNTVWLEPSCLLAPMPTGRYFGHIKSVGTDYGFIECLQTHKLYGRDVYFARAQLPQDSWNPSQWVSFAVTVNPKGQPQARSLEFKEPLGEAKSFVYKMPMPEGSDCGSTSGGDASPREAQGGSGTSNAPSVTHW